jgi:nickel/cobalt transporter (NiCoT) family protein
MIIGGVELLALLADKMGLTGGFWDWVSGLDLNYVGYVVVGLFVVTWIVALVVWRVARIEERWVTGPGTAPSPCVTEAAPEG